jgi:hypothetical protein
MHYCRKNIDRKHFKKAKMTSIRPLITVGGSFSCVYDCIFLTAFVIWRVGVKAVRNKERKRDTNCVPQPRVGRPRTWSLRCHCWRLGCELPCVVHWETTVKYGKLKIRKTRQWTHQARSVSSNLVMIPVKIILDYCYN